MPSAEHPGRPSEVFGAFLKLGLTSFGGPIAHLGYFRDEFVTRRRWLDETAYGDLVALCQFLPGPASSQVGFALGFLRAGLAGALLAWCAFTLPSAILLVFFATGEAMFDGPVGGTIIHGLKIVAVAVVAQALWGMARGLVPDRRRAGIMLVALVLAAALTGTAGQVLAIVAGAVLGLFLCRNGARKPAADLPVRLSRRRGLALLGVFTALLAGLPLLAAATQAQGIALFDAFYRSGALVFGGGHVVLPLLDGAVVGQGWIGPETFLAGYAAAQAVPGPLFTFAAYLGAAVTPWPNGVLGAGIVLVAIFLPGLLLILGALPFWNAVRAKPKAAAAMDGANAAVVGILALAFFDPVWTSAIGMPRDFVLALIAFLLLTVWRVPPWCIVLFAPVATSLTASIV